MLAVAVVLLAHTGRLAGAERQVHLAEARLDETDVTAFAVAVERSSLTARRHLSDLGDLGEQRFEDAGATAYDYSEDGAAVTMRDEEFEKEQFGSSKTDYDDSEFSEEMEVVGWDDADQVAQISEEDYEMQHGLVNKKVKKDITALGHKLELSDLIFDSDQAGKAPAKHHRGKPSFGWMRFANTEQDREDRRNVNKISLEAITAGGYTIGGKLVKLQHVEEMVRGTRIVSPTYGDWPDGGKLPKGFPCKKTSFHLVNNVVMDAAYKRAKGGKQVAVVGAASAYHPGGGFDSGVDVRPEHFLQVRVGGRSVGRKAAREAA